MSLVWHCALGTLCDAGSAAVVLSIGRKTRYGNCLLHQFTKSYLNKTYLKPNLLFLFLNEMAVQRKNLMLCLFEVK